MSVDRPEGWYPDPAGDQARERYWDGVSWSTATRLRDEVRATPRAGFTPAGRFDPSAQVHLQTWEPPSGAPAQAPKPRRRWGWLVGSILSLLLIGALIAAVVVLKPFKKVEPEDTASPSASPSATSTATPTPGAPTTPGATPSTSAVLSCANGSYSPSSRSTTYTSSGLAYDAPSTWSWRYDRSQWTWLDDPRVWGRVGGGGSDATALGVALGGLNKQHGFTDPATALSAYSRCITSYGPFQDFEVSQTRTEPASLSGATGQQVSMTLTDPDTTARFREYRVVIMVFDTGRTDQLSSITGFWPTGAPAMGDEVSRAMKSVRKA